MSLDAKLVAAAALPTIRALGGNATLAQLERELEVLPSRILRSLSLLRREGLVAGPENGVYHLTDEALAMMADNDAKISGE